MKTRTKLLAGIVIPLLILGLMVLLRPQGDDRVPQKRPASFSPTETNDPRIAVPNVAAPIGASQANTANVAASEPRATGTIKGKVLGPNGEPLSKGRAIILGQTKALEAPIQEGTFEGETSAGSVRCIIIPDDPETALAYQDLEIQASRTKETSLVLSPARKVSGRLLDAAGQQWIGAEVSLEIEFPRPSWSDSASVNYWDWSERQQRVLLWVQDPKKRAEAFAHQPTFFVLTTEASLHVTTDFDGRFTLHHVPLGGAKLVVKVKDSTGAEQQLEHWTASDAAEIRIPALAKQP